MVECPLCGEYEGSPQQVQAHISSKKDDAHAGRYGREFEGELGVGEGGQKGAESPQKADGGQPGESAPESKKGGQQSQESGQKAKQSGSMAVSAPGRGGRSVGTTVDLPELRCGECGRKVKYPELMTFKATCPGCGREIRKREAFEELEKQADEKGKDELAESKEV